MSRLRSNPPNRFDPTEVEWDTAPPRARLEVTEDHSRSILARNDSPDVGFTWSVNPYRGCLHGCAYCYARPSHEYLGLGAGTDFETRILVKPEAPRLLAEAFRKPSWRGEAVAFSGVVDCYQAIERTWRVTRRCLEVCRDHRNPVGIITRSDLVTRDLDLLVALNEVRAVRVTFSLPLLDAETCQALEPWAPAPSRRLAALRALSEAGIPVGVNIAPILPTLTEPQIPAILEAARDHGARWAHRILLRLPGAVATVFEERLRERLPLRADAVLAKQRRLRGGRLNDPRFRSRGRGEGPEWETVCQLFDLWHRKLGYAPMPPSPDPSPFRRPPEGGQLGLFG